MLRNYLLVSIRTLTKNAGYTFINVAGLAIGLACCLLVTLYVRFELSFDDFHPEGSHVYRYVARSERDGELSMQNYLPPGFGPLVKESFPEVEMYTRYSAFDDHPLLRAGERFLPAQVAVMVDPDFFRMFGFKLQEGDARSVLSKPNAVVIAQSIADSFFPDGGAVGKFIRYDNTTDFLITGVFDDTHANTHMQFKYVTSFETIARMQEHLYGIAAADFTGNFGSWNYPLYLLIPGEHDMTALASRMDKRLSEVTRTTYSPTPGDWLQPLDEIHFTKGIRGDYITGDRNAVYAFGAIALMILAIACFNFMNLSTARAIKRAKEVGLRKMMGAFQHQLIRQFLGETFVLVFASLFISVVVLEMMIPVLNALIGLQLSVSYFGQGSVLWIILLAGLMTALIAGSYPAFYLSSFVPAKVLKGNLSSAGSGRMRKLLIVMQFGVAIFLLMGTLAIYSQMKFIGQTDLGFNRENVIYFLPPAPIRAKEEAFKKSLMIHSQIESVTFSNGMPGLPSSHMTYAFPGTYLPDRSINTQVIDPDYFKTFGLELLEGAAMTTSTGADSVESFLVNETLVRDLMLKEPIGAAIRAPGRKPGRIIGIVKDFHYQSLHQRIQPLIFRMDPDNAWVMSVRLSKGKLHDHLAIVEREWRKFAPEHPFEYQFLDQTVAKQYARDESAGTLFVCFSSLAILIACLGLLGLTAFMTEQRRKEIGVRKVLGATVPNIVMLLSRDFSRLILIAFFIAVPLAYYSINMWLEQFAYRVRIQPAMYVVAGLAIIGIAWTAVAYQSIKAALINPTETLRSE